MITPEMMRIIPNADRPSQNLDTTSKADGFIVVKLDMIIRKNELMYEWPKKMKSPITNAITPASYNSLVCPN